jgi:putative flippase GtrA
MKTPAGLRTFNDVWRDHEKLRYLGIGVWNTAFAYLAFALVYMLLHDRIHYLLVSFIAHLLAVCNAFVCQRWLVFHSRTFWFKSFLRFNVAQLMVAGWGIIGVAFLVEIVKLRPLLAQLLAMTVTVVMSYFLSKNYAFRVQS